MPQFCRTVHSLLTLSLPLSLSLCRFLKIVRPLETHFLQKERSAFAVSVATWLLLGAVAGAYAIQALATGWEGPTGASRGSCNDLHSREVGMLYLISHSCSAAIFLLVLVSLVCFYWSTSRSLAAAQQRQAASSRSRTLVKARRNMLVLVVVFCVCFVPYHLVRLPYIFLWRRCSGGLALFYLKELSIMVSTFNICLDPLIYFIFCKAFRAQLSRTRRDNSRQNQEWAASVGHTKQEVGAQGEEVYDTPTAEHQPHHSRTFGWIRQKTETTPGPGRGARQAPESGQGSRPRPGAGAGSGAGAGPASGAERFSTSNN